MSISICAVFGVTPSVNSGEIFPYLVVIVGLENVLVVTRSVVSTPLNLEVGTVAICAMLSSLVLSWTQQIKSQLTGF